MNSTDATLEEWHNGANKKVIFLSMVHLGKPEFYKDAQQKINIFKKNGYVIFYEGVKPGYISDSALSPAVIKNYTKYPEVHTRNPDSLKRLIYNIKFKRMIGIYPDTTSYSNLIEDNNLFKNKMVQPSSLLLGITESDLNIDFTSVELVNLYEQTFGEIKLEQIDFAIPFNEPLPNFRKLKQNRVSLIIFDARNEHLANTIHNSTFNKILVVYGAGHQKGTFESLKRLDANWKILKH